MLREQQASSFPLRVHVQDDFIDSLFVQVSAVSRFFLAMDGIFIKDTFNLTILMAASIDTATHAALIAWTIVEKENEDAWRFVLTGPSLSFTPSHFLPGFSCLVFTLQSRKSITHLQQL